MAGELEVVDALRAAILRGDYAPRQRLTEVDLCEQFDATRFIVRTALQALAAEGLVEVQRNKGARIRAVSPDEAVEIGEVRMALEALVASRAAERVGKADKAELRGIIKEMRATVQTAQLLRYSELNVILHATIRRISGQHTATRILEQLRAQMARHQFQLALLPGRPAVSLGQHEQIVAAIVARDPAAAGLAMREHIASVVDALRSLSDRQAQLAATGTPPAEGSA
jgi:DNA-binding GntR family transcriptional regulator